ncbi:hypothetical protein pb186bvf_001194 [Paramecium bursaria]
MLKQQQIDNQQYKFFNIIRKYSQFLQYQGVDESRVEEYLDNIVPVPEDFEDIIVKKRQIIRIPKTEPIKSKPDSTQEDGEYNPVKQKRKYTKRQKDESKEPQKRKRRTKKEMEEAKLHHEEQKNSQSQRE